MSNLDWKSKIKRVENLVGNSPMVEITFEYKGSVRKVYAKMEHFNMTGSIKDRMALQIIKRGYKTGALKPGDMIIEATSGNTGIAFSGLGKALGHDVTIFMPDWMSEERKNIIKSFGANIELVSREEGGFIKSIALAEELGKKEGHSFLPRQFSNEDNVMAHCKTTAPELMEQLAKYGRVADAFVAGVGTGGTVMGVGKYLKSVLPNVKIHPVEPANSPTLSTGCKVGKHRIQGISDDFIPDVVKLDKVDEVISVDDGDSIIMAQRLASELGLGVGISSGGNFIGAVLAQDKLGKDSCVATVFADDNKKYLSTDLARQEPVLDSHISKDIKLIEFKSVTYR